LGLDGDLIPHLFETAKQMSGYKLALVFIKVIAPQFMVGLSAQKHMISTDQDGMSYGDRGTLLAASGGNTVNLALR
jgi:hypothetical protein